MAHGVSRSTALSTTKFPYKGAVEAPQRSHLVPRVLSSSTASTPLHPLQLYTALHDSLHPLQQPSGTVPTYTDADRSTCAPPRSRAAAPHAHLCAPHAHLPLQRQEQTRCALCCGPPRFVSSRPRSAWVPERSNCCGIRELTFYLHIELTISHCQSHIVSHTFHSSCARRAPSPSPLTPSGGAWRQRAPSRAVGGL